MSQVKLIEGDDSPTYTPWTDERGNPAGVGPGAQGSGAVGGIILGPSGQLYREPEPVGGFSTVPVDSRLVPQEFLDLPVASSLVVEVLRFPTRYAATAYLVRPVQLAPSQIKGQVRVHDADLVRLAKVLRYTMGKSLVGHARLGDVRCLKLTTLKWNAAGTAKVADDRPCGLLSAFPFTTTTRSYINEVLGFEAFVAEGEVPQPWPDHLVDALEVG